MAESAEPRGGEDWLSFHAYYHGDRDVPLRQAVLPLVGELRDASALAGFFFMRYSLGGPHLRLRLLPAAGREKEVRQVVGRRFEDFFARWPSTESQDVEEIRRGDAGILANDGGEAVEEAPPDNSLREERFQPEIERYGGSALLPASLRFFQVSSSAALQFVELAGELNRGKRLTAAARLLIRQAAAYGRDGEDFAGRIAYGTRWWQSWQPLLAKADAAYERSEAVYRTLLESSLLEPSDDPPLCLLERGAAGLGGVVAGAGEEVRERIVESQLHMTANRLGLGNADEVYLSRLLAHAAEPLFDSSPELWGGVEERLERSGVARAGLEHAARDALESL